MSNPRRSRGGRGSEFGRRDQSWGSPRSGSPGSPGVNGSPRTGRRDRREPGQQPPAALPSSEHNLYVEYLQKKWNLVQSKEESHPGTVTYWRNTDHRIAEPGPTFDVDRFFIERQINRKQATSSPPQPQPLHHPHHQRNMYTTGSDSW